MRVSTPRFHTCRILFLLLFLALGSSACERAGSSPSPDFFLGGIQINEPDLERWFATLRDAGMNTISVTNYARQGDWDSANLTWKPDPDLEEEIRRAKAAGMAVVLILRIQLDHAYPRNRFLWHGMIQPRDDATRAEWFSRYTEFALHWAEISARHGVDVLMLGSELNALTTTVAQQELPDLEEYYLNPEKQAERREEALRHAATMEELWMHHRDDFPSFEAFLDARIATEQTWAREVTGTDGDTVARAAQAAEVDRPEILATPLEILNARGASLDAHWRQLIEQVRDVYSGPLGYAANFDRYRQVSFWDALDVMGVNAYFPLREELLPDADDARLYAELHASWDAILREISSYRVTRALGTMPVIFSELGYTARAHSTLQPWADSGFAVLTDAAGEEQLVMLNEQPARPMERALAVRALHDAHREIGEDLLRGVLYWKLSTVESHLEHEAFMLWLTAPEEDPLVAELRRFILNDIPPTDPTG